LPDELNQKDIYYNYGDIWCCVK